MVAILGLAACAPSERNRQEEPVTRAPAPLEPSELGAEFLPTDPEDTYVAIGYEDIAFDGENYQTITNYGGDSVSSYVRFSQRVDRSGDVLDVPGHILADEPGSGAVLARAGANTLALWTDQYPGASPPSTLRCARLGTDGALTAEGVVSAASIDGFRPDRAVSGGDTILVQWRLGAVVLDDTCAVQGAPLTFPQSHGAAFDGVDYWVLTTSGGRLRTERVSAAGAIVGSPLDITATSVGFTASIASSGGKLFIAYAAGEDELDSFGNELSDGLFDTASPIRHRVVTAGTVSAETTLAENTHVGPLVTAVGDHFAVAGFEGTALDRPGIVHLITIDQAGARLGSRDYPNTDAPGGLVSDGSSILFEAPVTQGNCSWLADANLSVASGCFGSLAMQREQRAPSVAFNGWEFLTTYEENTEFAAPVQRAARFLPGGERVGTPLVVAGPTPSTRYAVTHSNGDGFLIAWREGQGLKARRVSRDGQLLDDPPLQVSNPEAGINDIRISSNLDDYLVVWGSPTSNQLQGARVSREGTVLDAPPLTIYDGGVYCMDVTFDGTNYLVSYATTRDTPLSLARVSPEGQLLTTLSTDIGACELDLAWGDGTGLVVWSEKPEVGVWTTRILASIFDSTGATISGPTSVAATGYRNGRPEATWDGVKYWVTWRDARRSDYAMDLYAARIGAAGAVLDPEGFGVSTPPDIENPHGRSDNQGLAAGLGRVAFVYTAPQPLRRSEHLHLRARTVGEPFGTGEGGEGGEDAGLAGEAGAAASGGSGGSSSGQGGAVARGGRSSRGGSSTGGAKSGGTGGRAGVAGAPEGGDTGEPGGTSGRGGAGGGGVPQGGSGNVSHPKDGGCACTLPSRGPSGGAAFGALFLLVGLTLARRRKDRALPPSA
jgi:hypothetical protein